jgi:hypothetical protein
MPRTAHGIINEARITVSNEDIAEIGVAANGGASEKTLRSLGRAVAVTVKSRHLFTCGRDEDQKRARSGTTLNLNLGNCSNM